MANRHQTLRTQLQQIEAEMKRLGLWRHLPPPPDAFDNDTPFHADSMDFDNWLQWVLIARFHALLDAEASLPTRCAIAPMAEQVWQEGSGERRHLLALLADFDALFEAQPPQ
jgi:uncharacterized protein YqcC (DUF446 family)